jgi:acetate kinase
MKILIANPGSTSYKCKLFETKNWGVIFQASVERIGEAQGIVSYQFEGKEKFAENRQVPDYAAAVNLTLEILQQRIPTRNLSAVGFKVVLAKNVTGCVELTDAVLNAMRDYEPLAPVHTRVYLNAVSVFEKILPNIPRVGLFETAFHVSIPPEAHLYGVPYRYYEKYGIRK